MRKFDVRFKRKVVREYFAGKEGYKLLAEKFCIANIIVRRWVEAYRHHGEAEFIRLMLLSSSLRYCSGAWLRTFPVDNWPPFTIWAIRTASRCGTNRKRGEKSLL